MFKCDKKTFDLNQILNVETLQLIQPIPKEILKIQIIVLPI
jgi:hypothetical protein